MILFAMKQYFSKIKYSFVSLFILSLISSRTLAVCQNGQLPDPFHPDCSGTPPTVGDIIASFVPIIPVAVGMLLFGVLLWGAIQIFTSGPDDKKKQAGFQTIQNAIIGVVILLFSVGIIVLIEAVTGAKILYGVKI